MKTLSKKICVVLAVLAALCFGMMALLTFTPAEASAAVEGYTTTDFKMLDKGSIRKNADSNGIRFATFIGEESAQASYDFETEYELGTLFLPKAAMEAGDELTIDGTYKNGVKAIAAVFDGDMTNLTSDGTYTDGKLFNAVLELSDFTGNANALNGKIVARTYVKKLADGSISYCDAVERAPAYVAAMAIEASEEDTNNTLSTYVQHVEIVAPDVINVGSWGALSTWGQATKLDLATNVEGINVTYAAKKGLISTPGAYAGSAVQVDLIKLYDADEDGAVNDIIGLNEGDCFVTAKFAGKTQDIPVTVSLPQVAFFGKTYVPSGNFTIRAANVATVKYEGATLVAGTDYTYDADSKTLVIAKSKIFPSYTPYTDNVTSWGSEANVAAVDKKVEITTTGGAVSTVEVYARQVAKIAFFESGNYSYNASKIKELVFLDAKITDYNIGDLALNPGKINAARGALSIGRISDSVAIGYINLNSDYVKCYGIDVDKNASGAGLYLQWSCDGTFSVMNGTDATGKQLAWTQGAGYGRTTQYASDSANLTFGDGIESLDVNINIITDVKEESLAGDLTVTDFLFMYCETKVN